MGCVDVFRPLLHPGNRDGLRTTVPLGIGLDRSSGNVTRSSHSFSPTPGDRDWTGLLHYQLA